MNRGAVAGVAADVRSGSLADIAAALPKCPIYPRKRTSGVNEYTRRFRSPSF